MQGHVWPYEMEKPSIGGAAPAERWSYVKVLLDIVLRFGYTGFEVIIMPSDKKRINLTVPDSLYERLQIYKVKNGIANDASACLQLITQQLNGQESMEIMLKLVQELSVDQLVQMSKEGFTYTKEGLAKLKEPKAAK